MNHLLKAIGITLFILLIVSVLLGAAHAILHLLFNPTTRPYLIGLIVGIALCIGATTAQDA
jgi:heme A synthase